MKIELSRKDRERLAGALNREMHKKVREYHASCDAGRPNKVLFVTIGEMRRLRERLLTGKSERQLIKDETEAAELTERAFAA